MSLLSRLVGGTNLVTHRLGRCARELRQARNNNARRAAGSDDDDDGAGVGRDWRRVDDVVRCQALQRITSL